MSEGASEDEVDASGDSRPPRTDLRFGQLSENGVRISRQLDGEGHHLARGDRTRNLGISFRLQAQPRERSKLAPIDRPAEAPVPAASTAHEPAAPQPPLAAAVEPINGADQTPQIGTGPLAWLRHLFGRSH